MGGPGAPPHGQKAPQGPGPAHATVFISATPDHTLSSGSVHHHLPTACASQAASVPLSEQWAPWARTPFFPLASFPWWTPTHPPKPSPEVASSGKPSLIHLNRIYLLPPTTPLSHCLTGDPATFALRGNFSTHVRPTFMMSNLGTETVPPLCLFATTPSRVSDMWEGSQCMFAELNESPGLEP